jgi:signal transduction histidine kinase/CheY-like chemotaxis protein
MATLFSLRARLVGTVFLAIAPAWVVMYLFAYDPPWMRFAVGLMALGAAWFGGERFIMRQVRSLLQATRLLASGDLAIRTGLDKEAGELGDLARDIDQMAAALQQKVRDREKVEKILLSRTLQQTVVSALGQFALSTKDVTALLNQASMMVSQTLEVEYCHILELQPDKQTLLLRAGVGWNEGTVGKTTIPNDRSFPPGCALAAGEPVVMTDLRAEKRFKAGPLLSDHGVVSGVVVAVTAQERPFGVLGAYTTNKRRFNEDEVHFLLAVATLLAMAAARHATEADLQKLASFAKLNPNPAMEIDSFSRVTYSNDAARQLAETLGCQDPQQILPQDCAEIIRGCLATNQPVLNKDTELNRRHLSWAFHPVQASKVVHAYVEDATQRLNLESQLRQSQKMECVGQLAAGVAHDFNNMLTIIQGHAGLLLVKRETPKENRDGIHAITFAAERAAALTRQLLMFSRKNVIQPKLLDPTDTAISTTRLLQRLLGETITLEIQAPQDLPLVLADSGMLEQVIMNLAVNARDAMPRGGTLTISLSAGVLDEVSVQGHSEARPGSFVRIDVSDTGIGMEPATLGHIFEPFFTTKEIGKGTGLGLATVYGIIKQHEGWIEVESQPGAGTTFSIFLPAHERPEPAQAAPETEPQQKPLQGKETILLVEDEPVLREMAQAILENCGYRVIPAASGPEALRVWDLTHETIDLVLTDMVMPEGMSGMDLAHHLSAQKPGVKIIFASGYSMDDLDTQFLRKGYAGFLQKPYTHASLTDAIRSCLDSKTPVAT